MKVYTFCLNVYSTKKHNRDKGPKEQTGVRPIMHFTMEIDASRGVSYRTDNQGRLAFTDYNVLPAALPHPEAAAEAAVAVLAAADSTEGGSIRQPAATAADGSAMHETAVGQYLESLGLSRYQSAFYADEIFEMRQMFALVKEDLLVRSR